jgi:hypothetical protein
MLSNAGVVPAGAGGAVNVFTTDNTYLVIDIKAIRSPGARRAVAVRGDAMPGASRGSSRLRPKGS